MEENILQFLVPVKTPKCVPRQEVMAYLPIVNTLGQSTKHAASQKLVSDVITSNLEFLIEQSKGTATDRVMSQKAVTVELKFLQNEINVLKNNPDVVDIVNTKAALDLYDTSNLSDKDIIRVLVDETHDGASTFYRWNLSQKKWNYIGKVGDYYTKSEVNTLIADKQDKLDVEVPAYVDADINLTLENNKQFRYGYLFGAINISFPSNPALDFMCEVEIESLPSMSYPNNIKWSGDDIENGVFVPDSKALTRYQILFYTSGVSNNIWNAIVRKPSV